MLRRLVRWLTGESAYVASVNTRFTAMDRAAERNRREMEANPQKLYCPKCKPWREIDTFSYENDYCCDFHGFVNPIREDGVVVAGDGQCGSQRAIRRVQPPELGLSDDAAG